MAALSLPTNLGVSALQANASTNKRLSTSKSSTGFVRPARPAVAVRASADEEKNSFSKAPGLSVLSTMAATAASLIITSNVNAAVIQDNISVYPYGDRLNASEIYVISGLAEKASSDIGSTSEKIGSDVSSTAEKMKSDVSGTASKIGSDIGSTSGILSQGPESVKGAVASAQKGGQDLGSKVQEAIKSPFSGLPNPLENLGKQSSGEQSGELYGSRSGFGAAEDKVKSDIDSTSQKVGSDIESTQKFFSEGPESAKGPIASIQKGAQDLSSKVQGTMTSPFSGAVNPLEELGKKENVGQTRTDELTGKAKSTVPQPEDIARNLGSKAETARESVAQVPGGMGQRSEQGGFFSNLFKGAKGKVQSDVESTKETLGGGGETGISTKPI